MAPCWCEDRIQVSAVAGTGSPLQDNATHWAALLPSRITIPVFPKGFSAAKAASTLVARAAAGYHYGANWAICTGGTFTR